MLNCQLGRTLDVCEAQVESFPDRREAVVQMKKDEAEAKAQADRLEAQRLADLEAARLAAIAKPITYTTYAPQSAYGALTGSYGYAIAGGNCVNQVPFALRGVGNPINWPVLTQTPYIGAAALWYFNHTARVVGLWSNGDIEVAQENWSGVAITRFPRATFRGFR